MSFVLGSVGTLMTETRLTEVQVSVFGGVGEMLTGKKFPQNVLWLVAEELLKDIVLQHPSMFSTTDLLEELERRSSLIKTTKLWVNMLIKPVLLTLMYVRAERKCDSPRHLDNVRQLIPYFFTARRTIYARYGIYYMKSITCTTLPRTVLYRFMDGEHVMRHIQGVWNGIWSDMFIETTFMRYGHVKDGIISITLKP